MIEGELTSLFFICKSEETADKSLPTWKLCYETLMCLLILYNTKNVGNQKCTENPPKEIELMINNYELILKNIKMDLKGMARILLDASIPA